MTYTNPMGFAAADPCVLQVDSVYYLYATTRTSSGFEVYTSPDLAHWRRRGLCYEETENSWGKTDFWAPEVIKKDNTYYLYYTARNVQQGIRNTCVATSASPMGPFTDIKAPMFPERSYIDGHVFLDDASGKYFFYVTEEGRVPSTIVGAQLSDNMVECATTFTACLRPNQEWEDGWIEGPFIIKRDKWYYMMYSGSAFWEPAYAVGYATATHPLGPWTKAQDNPILHKVPGVDGPGHNGVAWSPDGTELFMVYHRHATFYNARREIAIDRLGFVPGGGSPDRLALVAGVTTTPQPLPSGSMGYLPAASDDFSSNTMDFNRWISIGEDASAWKVADGALQIATAPGEFSRSRDSGKNLFLQHAPDTSFTISTEVEFPVRFNTEQAGLTVWQDQDNYILLSVGAFDGPGFAVVQERHGKNTSFVYPNRFGSKVNLRIQAHEGKYRFFSSQTGAAWNEIGGGVHSDLHPSYVGLGAWSGGSERTAHCRFERFEFAGAP